MHALGCRHVVMVAAICAIWLSWIAPTAASAALKPGSIALSSDQGNELCGGSDSNEKVSSTESTLLPDGRIALVCSDGEIVFYDLTGKYVAWSINTSSYAGYAIGTQHLFLVSATTVPPTGLQAATTTYTLTEKALDTGATVWTVPFNGPSTDFGVGYEGPSGNPAHPTESVLNFSTTMSSFDSSTGATIWNFNGDGDYLSSTAYFEDIGEYLGYGINLAVHSAGDSDSSAEEVATSAATGQTVWQQPVLAAATADGQIDPDAEIPDNDGNVWLFWDGGFDERNIATGAEGSSGTYPSDWSVSTGFLGDTNVYFAPPYAVYASDSELELYNLANVNTPVWSVPADDVSVLAVGTHNALISADSGNHIVSLSNGSIIAAASSDPDNDDGIGFGGWGTPVDGYLPFVGYAGVTVLALDPPSVTIAQSAPPARKSPGLKWAHATRRGKRKFVITGKIDNGASGSVELHVARGDRKITSSCKVSHSSIRCTITLPIFGVWSASLAYTTHSSSYRSSVTGAHRLHAL